MMEYKKTIFAFLWIAFFFAACSGVYLVDNTPSPDQTLPPVEETPSPIDNSANETDQATRPIHPDPNITLSPGPVEAALAFLLEKYGFSSDQVTLVKKEEVMWPDSCLGVYYKDQMCADVITPGYLLVFNTPLGELEVRTDKLGLQIRLPSASLELPQG